MSAESIVLAVAMAVAAGLVGCFAVMRRMALSADALSHVALPGIGVAIALHVHPLVGALSMLFFGALLVWALEHRARLATETIIGVVFSAALAVGSMIASGEDLIEALFGGGGALSPFEIAFGVVAAAAVVTFMVKEKHALVLVLVSPDIARTAGVRLHRLNLLFLQMFALTIALGLRYLGVLLMGSLIIIPAATAKRLSRKLNQMLILSAAIAVTTTIVGAWLASWLHRETGPVIVALAAGCFLLTFLRRP